MTLQKAGALSEVVSYTFVLERAGALELQEPVQRKNRAHLCLDFESLNPADCDSPYESESGRWASSIRRSNAHIMGLPTRPRTRKGSDVADRHLGLEECGNPRVCLI